MNRKTLILGGVLIALIVLAYAYQGPLKKWQSNLGKPKNILAKIDTAKIDKIEIALAGNVINLSKQGAVSTGTAQAKWKYNNSKDFYVDQILIANALESLGQAAKSDAELISNNQERKSEFNTDSAGLAITIYQSDKKVADFIVGALARDSFGSYISAAESAATYLVKADLISAFGQKEWRDLTIFSSAKEKINKIRFQYPNREFSVEMKDGKWSGVLPEKFSVNQEKMEKIRQIMSDLKAKEIPEQTFNNTGLEKHLIIVQAAGEAIDNVLMVGEKKGELYYAKRGDSDNIYLIDKAIRDELDKWIWQLK